MHGTWFNRYFFLFTITSKQTGCIQCHNCMRRLKCGICLGGFKSILQWTEWFLWHNASEMNDRYQMRSRQSIDLSRRKHMFTIVIHFEMWNSASTFYDYVCCWQTNRLIVSSNEYFVAIHCLSISQQFGFRNVYFFYHSNKNSLAIKFRLNLSHLNRIKCTCELDERWIIVECYSLASISE